MLVMAILEPLWPVGSVASGLATLSMAVVLGLAIGGIRVRGIKLGIAGVMFSSLLFGQLGLTPGPDILSFLRDFALILFVYAIGLQVGPGFVDSLKAEGLRLNMLSIAVLVVGAGMTAAVVKGIHVERAITSGLYAGAFTTTPGLAAAQEVLRHGPSADADAAAKRAGLAYAVTYPFGIVGPVLTIALLRRLFHVKLDDEKQAHIAASQARRPPGGFLDLEVTNADLHGKTLRELNLGRGRNVIVSRLLRGGTMTVPTADTRLQVGDVIRAIGNMSVIEEIAPLIGKRSTVDLATVAGALCRTEIYVTRTAVLRRTVRELDLINRHGVALPRLVRSGIELVPNGAMTLHFGDVVTAVGPSKALKVVEEELGNSPDALNHAQLIPIFLGMGLGVVVGSVPIPVPGIQGGIQLGLAAGPMLVAIALSRLGSIGSVVWHMPASANQLFRDFGLAVFLACVGLQQGDHFTQKLFTGGGLSLLVWGAVITMLPVLVVGIAARRIFKMNFLTLSGWVAGAMTSSPALMYASDITGSDAPALAYAGVAPLAMIVPILCCQALAALT
jgi:putative transport protein